MKLQRLISTAALAVAVLASVSIAGATSVCTTTTYAALEASGGCTVGDLLFSNFQLNIVVNADAIVVTPTTEGLVFSGPTVDFNGGFYIGTANVSTLGQNSFIDSTTVSIASGLQGSQQSFCIGAGNNFSGGFAPSNCTNPSATAFLSEGVGTASASDNAKFNPVQSITEATVFVNSVTSPTSFLTWTVGEVTIAPEPSTMVVLSVGLAGMLLGYLRRNRLKNSRT